MCGLVAILSLKGRPVSPATIMRGLDTLQHRGPDGRRVWMSPCGRVGLGHARLSVIDLETGDQPIANEDETARIVVNGEFYDFERQRRELERAGHCLKTRSDSEVALHFYEDEGKQHVHRLRGEYAYVIWDDRSRCLTAVRDRFGVKPLYYAVHEDTLYLASEIKALLAAGVPANWDAEGLYASFAFRPPGMTQFTGVHAVPPGRILTADETGVTLDSYWDMDYPQVSARVADWPQVADDSSLVGEFRNRLDEAVRLRLRADVAVACYLSGGIDSSAILGLAARHSEHPISAFTLRFDHPEYDEGALAREMAHKAGAEWIEVPIEQSDLADHFNDAVYHAESQCINAHFVAKYLLSRAVRDAGFKVVLTGEGADELLAGYPHFREDLLRSERRRGLSHLRADNEISHGVLLSTRGEGDLASLNAALGFTPAMFRPVGDRLLRLAPLLNREFFETIDAADHGELLLRHLDVPGRLAGRAVVHQSQYLWAKTALPNYVLALLGDRMEMAHSIEGRVPFLDHEVAEFLATVPVNLKIRSQSEKYILREATRDLVTESIRTRQKNPFLSPPSPAGVSAPMNILLQDTLRSAAAADSPFLDAPAVRDLADDLDTLAQAERRSIDSDLMTLASLVMLHQRFVYKR